MTVLAQASGAALDKPVVAIDADGDGVAEKLEDPNGRLESQRTVPLLDGQLALAIAPRGTQTAATQVVALWNPVTNEVYNVASAPPVAPAVLVPLQGERLKVSVTVDKGGWITVPVDDACPECPIELVQRGDGSLIAVGAYWRIPGYVIVLDDPSTEYSVIYGPRPTSAAAQDSPWWPWLVAGLVGAAVAAYQAPSGAWLDTRRRPGNVARWELGYWLDHAKLPKAGRRGAAKARLAVDGAVWRVYHCASCGAGLTRRQRLARGFHNCGPFTAPVMDHDGDPFAHVPVQWATQPGVRRVAVLRRVLAAPGGQRVPRIPRAIVAARKI